MSTILSDLDNLQKIEIAISVLSDISVFRNAFLEDKEVLELSSLLEDSLKEDVKPSQIFEFLLGVNSLEEYLMGEIKNLDTYLEDNEALFKG